MATLHFRPRASWHFSAKRPTISFWSGNVTLPHDDIPIPAMGEQIPQQTQSMPDFNKETPGKAPPAHTPARHARPSRKEVKTYALP